MAVVVALINQKGGVAKTTTAVNLATALAARQQKILVIDIDPQANATTALLTEPLVPLYDVLTGDKTMKQAIQATNIPYLSAVAASVDLAGLDHEFYNTSAPESRLKKAITTISHDYDYIFIDCPPSLNILTINSMVAAQELLIPMQCEFYALEGLSRLLGLVKKIQNNFNPDLLVEGIVFTMYDDRSNLTRAVVDDVKKHFQKEIYQTIIPRNIKVAEAPSYGKPVLLYDLKSVGAQAHVALAQEFLSRHA